MQLVKPWGKERIIRHLKGITLKILEINGRLSLQKHNHKNELWLVRSIVEPQGLTITVGERRHYIADVGDYFEIPVGTVHRAEGKGEIIELSYEDIDTFDSDIERLSDDYGRKVKVIRS